VEVLKVSSKSNPNACAGALAGVLRQEGAVEVQVVGAGALNQAVKAVAIARGFVAPSGIDLVCVPTFADIEIDGENRTAIRLLLEDRHRRSPLNGDLDGVVVDGRVDGGGAAAEDGRAAASRQGPQRVTVEAVVTPAVAPAVDRLS
jgi:stage V sporulation protein S